MLRFARQPQPPADPDAPGAAPRLDWQFIGFVALSFVAHGCIIALAAAWIGALDAPSLTLPTGAADEAAIGDATPDAPGVRITMVPAPLPPPAPAPAPPTSLSSAWRPPRPVDEPPPPTPVTTTIAPPPAPAPTPAPAPPDPSANTERPPAIAAVARDLAAAIADRLDRFDPAAALQAVRLAAAEAATPPPTAQPDATPIEPDKPPPPSRSLPTDDDTPPQTHVASGGVSGGVEGPVALSSNVPPRYPIESRRRREEGVVTLALVIGADGRVQQAHVGVSSGYAALDAAALAAAHTWRFAPGRVFGAPTSCPVTAPVRFMLRRQPAGAPGAAD